MNAPWFDTNLYAWIPGTFTGIFYGSVIPLIAFYATKGEKRRPMMMLYNILTFLSMALLLTGAAAFSLGQPFGIWFAFGIPGLITTVLMISFRKYMIKAFEAGEIRRLEVEDL